ncbi:hypothetical protein TNCV_1836501 [Trichonephila clavipes]|nr:hypothetical protein TNCV_1836501 [Trichonephila clavipes]
MKEVHETHRGEWLVLVKDCERHCFFRVVGLNPNVTKDSPYKRAGAHDKTVEASRGFVLGFEFKCHEKLVVWRTSLDVESVRFKVLERGVVVSRVWSQLRCRPSHLTEGQNDEVRRQQLTC